MSQEFFQAIQEGNLHRLAALLDGDPELASARSAAGVSAVSTAMYYGRADLVRLLLDRGARLDFFDACATGDLERVTEIAGRDPGAVNSFSPDGFPALGLAAFFGHEEVVRHLLDGGAHTGAAAKNATQVQPVHAAVARRSSRILRMLLERGADPNARQQQAFTPLHAAAQNGDRECVDLLLAHGAERAPLSTDGRTPAQLAREKGHEDVALLLEA